MGMDDDARQEPLAAFVNRGEGRAVTIGETVVGTDQDDLVLQHLEYVERQDAQRMGRKHPEGRRLAIWPTAPGDRHFSRRRHNPQFCDKTSRESRKKAAVRLRMAGKD